MQILDECCESLSDICAVIRLKLECDFNRGVNVPTMLNYNTKNQISYWNSSVFCPNTQGRYDEQRQVIINPRTSRELDLTKLLATTLVEVCTSFNCIPQLIRALKLGSVLCTCSN